MDYEIINEKNKSFEKDEVVILVYVSLTGIRVNVSVKMFLFSNLFFFKQNDLYC